MILDINVYVKAMKTDKRNNPILKIRFSSIIIAY